MARWGRGWEVGLNKSIDEHNRAILQASEILATEHGSRHEPGDRPDLCQKCKAMPKPPSDAGQAVSNEKMMAAGFEWDPTHNGYPRWSNFEKNVTALRQPYMTDAQWQQHKREKIEEAKR